MGGDFHEKILGLSVPPKVLLKTAWHSRRNPGQSGLAIHLLRLAARVNAANIVDSNWPISYMTLSCYNHNDNM